MTATRHRGLAPIAVLAAVLVLLPACDAGDPAGTGGRAGGMAAPASAPGDRWRPVAGLQVPRDDFVSAVVDGEIWVLGGMTGDRGNRLTSIEVYDPAADSWRTSEVAVPEGLASLEGVARGRSIYVFGGLDSETRPSDFSAVLDTDSGTWRRLPPLPHPRYAHTVTQHDDLIYVIGGESAAGPVVDVDVFDPGTGTWSSGGRMPAARGSHDAVATGRGIYVLGGWVDAGPSDLVQLYRPEDRRWTEEPPLPEPVSRAGAALLDGRLWVTYHRFGATYDLRTQRWSAAPHPPLSRHGLGLVALGDRLFAIAGCSEQPLRDVRTVDVLQT